MYKEDNPLFTKESKLNNGDKYISGWEGAYNSETNAYDSFQSKEILETGFSLKFYNTKGGQKDVNSLGIIKANFFKHCYEAGMETIERTIYGDEADNDPLYDMHNENAESLLKKLNP